MSDPTHVTCPLGHSHSGSGTPQYLVRDTAQSVAPPGRAKPPSADCQSACPARSRSRSRNGAVEMYHEVIALVSTRVPHRQQRGTVRACWYAPNSRPRSDRSAAIAWLELAKNRPLSAGMVWSKRPSGPSGSTALVGSPASGPTPKAGARTAMPVGQPAGTSSSSTCTAGAGLSAAGRKGGSHLAPASSAPVTVAATCQPSPSTRAKLRSASMTLSPCPARLASAYVSPARTATPVLAASVHGAVVHASRSAPPSRRLAVPPSPCSRRRTITAVSVTRS